MSFLTCDMIDISIHDPLENDTRTKTQALSNEFDDATTSTHKTHMESHVKGTAENNVRYHTGPANSPRDKGKDVKQHKSSGCKVLLLSVQPYSV